MASYLDDFLESISSLPSELRRSFSLMRELDYRTEELKGSLEKNTKHYLSSVRKNPKHSEDSSIKSLYKHIQEDQKTCTELADEKVKYSQSWALTFHTTLIFFFVVDGQMFHVRVTHSTVQHSSIIFRRFSLQSKRTSWLISTSGVWTKICASLSLN
eukprot:TRINITY_DN4132_c0_g1_i6.p2 TRINITY_DN4132_c0_g1~~TRINITY_DN4132_c0_g1_i6.p2  ORF type:complete len:157 (-),score=13.52 TRINITY_DN4132_c0_g1_i6:498-968(-)